MNTNRISTNVMESLNCSRFVKEIIDDTVVIYFVNRSELPEKKIIMLSATVNETICKLMFGDRLSFVDIGHVENCW